MPDRKPKIVLPPNAAMAQAIEAALRTLSVPEGEEFLLDLDKWAMTVHSGRIREGLLNRRYEICVLDAHPPFAWIVGAYDTAQGEFVLAALLRGMPRPNLSAAANLCGQAFNEPVQRVEP